MKKIGTLNAHLSHVLAAMGHTDRLVICDSGLPIPRGADVVDLALTANVPRFLEALAVVLEELEVEGALVAEEMEARSNGIYGQVRALLGDVPIQQVSHEEFKRLSGEDNVVAFVRTGEATPYANVMLIAGVTF